MKVLFAQDAPINRVGATPKSYWTYQAATETPTLEKAIQLGAVPLNTTQAEWDKLTPGMKREICRQRA